MPQPWTLRRMRLDDADALASLQTTASGVGVPPDAVRNMLVLPGFQASQDGLVAEHEGQVVGFVRVLTRGDVAKITFTIASGSPRQLIEQLLKWALERVRKLTDVRTVETYVDGTDTSAVATIESMGFHHFSSNLTMVNENPGRASEPQWPEGVEPRHLSESDVVDAITRAYEGSFSDQPEYEHRDRHSWQTELEDSDPDLWLLAFEKQEVVGFCISALMASASAQLGPIGTIASQRNRGIGRALLRQTLRDLAIRGVRCVRLMVDSRNPTSAGQLYLSEGFQVTRDWRIYAYHVPQASNPGRMKRH